MTIPADLIPLVARFRPQRDGETDRAYIRAAFKAARDLPLECLENLIDELQTATAEDESNAVW